MVSSSFFFILAKKGGILLLWKPRSSVQCIFFLCFSSQASRGVSIINNNGKLVVYIESLAPDTSAIVATVLPPKRLRALRIARRLF